jgi:hypothetical protein
MPDDAAQEKPRPQARRSAMLLASYAALSGWLFYEQATSWPHEGHWALLGYVIFLPGIVFQSVSLCYAKIAGRPLTRRFLARLVTVPLGIALAAMLQAGASSLAMSGFERAYAPFVAQLGTTLAGACDGGRKYFEIPSVAAFNEHTGSRPTALLHHDGKRFVLGFMGGSIDIDGSTLYYDSGTREWRRYHNDNQEARAVHQKLVAGLADCKLSAVVNS